MLWVQAKPCNSALAMSDRVRNGSRITQEGRKTKVDPKPPKPWKDKATLNP